VRESGSKPVDDLRGLLIGSTATALLGGLDQLVRRNLRGVWVRGDLPSGAAVWAANHHSWWDWFVALAALRADGRRDVGVLMDAANIPNAALYERAGAIGAHRLRTAVSTLQVGAVLVVFPEGALRAAGPLGEVRPGARWLAERAGVPLIPVATRVLLRGQQSPEAYLDVGPACEDGDVERALGTRLADLDRELHTADPEQPLDGFRSVVVGVRSMNERFAAFGARRADETAEQFDHLETAAAPKRWKRRRT
jgi:1-acyl-sn-glycerol-3-phosphate acyltransferase